MNKVLRNQKGIGLLEIVLAVAIFTVGIASVGHLFVSSYLSSAYSTERQKASFLAREGVEALRSIKGSGFDELSVIEGGGVDYTSDRWQLIESSTEIDQFTREINIEEVSEDQKLVEVIIGWENIRGREDQVILSEIFTSWEEGYIMETDFSCGQDFTDDRDGETYATVQVGDQCWMAESLRIDCESYDSNYNNVGEAEEWSGSNNCGEIPDYNHLHYQWDVAMDGSTTEGVQGLCPDEWRVPSDDDWRVLEGNSDSTWSYQDFLDWDSNDTGYRGDDVGDRLKDEEEEWFYSSPKTVTGVDLLPGGSRLDSGFISSLGWVGMWWTSSESGDGEAWTRRLDDTGGEVSRVDYNSKESGLSINCMKDL